MALRETPGADVLKKEKGKEYKRKRVYQVYGCLSWSLKLKVVEEGEGGRRRDWGSNLHHTED